MFDVLARLAASGPIHLIVHSPADGLVTVVCAPSPDAKTDLRPFSLTEPVARMADQLTATLTSAEEILAAAPVDPLAATRDAVAAARAKPAASAKPANAAKPASPPAKPISAPPAATNRAAGASATDPEAANSTAAAGATSPPAQQPPDPPKPPVAPLFGRLMGTAR